MIYDSRKRDGTFSIANTTKGGIPTLPFFDIKEAVLGKKYSLSLVFIGDKLSRKLNKQYRKKDVRTNILSFPIVKNEGEIFINTKKAREEARQNNTQYKIHLAHLFIHGLIHLKGYTHSSTMEREEAKVFKKFFKDNL
ncbi:rRNA maturation RNase YbeY [bacterium]|nr:rRNA maturation RNase YbeY [bacterium]|tara:strand:- start:10312 stop:10725 length:414 start_codon:yes stop_codon:yes gene_type:complete